jgi:hypothetical protein
MTVCERKSYVPNFFRGRRISKNVHHTVCLWRPQCNNLPKVHRERKKDRLQEVGTKKEEQKKEEVLAEKRLPKEIHHERSHSCKQAEEHLPLNFCRILSIDIPIHIRVFHEFEFVYL